MPERYFITGATGFIGQTLAAFLLNMGAYVKCLARPSSNREFLQSLGVEFVEGDLFDTEALQRGVEDVDYVIHVAGLTRETRRGDFLRVNSGGVESLLQACLARKERVGAAPNILLISSLAASGYAPRIDKSKPQVEQGVSYDGRRLLVETDTPHPISAYGRSKFLAEQIATRFADRLAITIVRPPYVYGPGDVASAQLFVMAQRRGNFVNPGFRDRYYSFVCVNDLIRGLIAAVHRGERLTPESLTPVSLQGHGRASCSGVGVYFIADPTPIRFSQFGQLIGQACSRERVRVFRVPPAGVLGAGVYGEVYKKLTGRSAVFDWNKAREALSGPWICSPVKAQRDLGFEIRQTMLESLCQATQWYRMHEMLD